MTFRDLLTTYIVYICFQNKYKQNIRGCDVGDDCDADDVDGGVVCFQSTRVVKRVQGLLSGNLLTHVVACRYPFNLSFTTVPYPLIIYIDVGLYSLSRPYSSAGAAHLALFCAAVLQFTPKHPVHGMGPVHGINSSADLFFGPFSASALSAVLLFGDNAFGPLSPSSAGGVWTGTGDGATAALVGPSTPPSRNCPPPLRPRRPERPRPRPFPRVYA